MKFFFCERCGKRIMESDLDRGDAKDKKLKGVFCSDCAVGVMTMEAAPLTEEEARKVLDGQKTDTANVPIPTPTETGSTRRMPNGNPSETGVLRAQQSGRAASKHSAIHTSMARSQRKTMAATPSSNSSPAAVALIAGGVIATLGGVLLIMGSGGASGETRSRREPAEVRVESVTRTSSTANAPAGSASRPASDPQEPARPQEKSADAPSALQKEFEAVQALMRSSDTPQEERIAAGRAFADKYPGTLEASRVRVQVEKLEAPPEPPRVAEDAPVNDPAPPGGSIESLFRRAQALEREYDREGAIAVYRQILGKEPRHHVALTNMAYCKMALLQLEHALKDAQRAIEIRENFWNAWAVVSVCQYGLGRTEEATAALEKAKQYAVNPTEVAQLILRESSGIRSRYQGKRLEGKDLRSAQEFGLRGQYRLAVRKWSEALEDLDKAAELDPGLAEQGIYTAMADAAGQLKDNARRLGYLRKWAEAQADSAEANNGYAWELLTSADASLRDPKTALPFARKAVEQSFNSNPSILDTLGLALFRNGETKEAIEIQRKAIALLPLDTKAETRKEFEDRLKEFEAAK